MTVLLDFRRLLVEVSLLLPISLLLVFLPLEKVIQAVFEHSPVEWFEHPADCVLGRMFADIITAPKTFHSVFSFR